MGPTSNGSFLGCVKAACAKTGTTSPSPGRAPGSICRSSGAIWSRGGVDLGSSWVCFGLICNRSRVDQGDLGSIWGPCVGDPKSILGCSPGRSVVGTKPRARNRCHLRDSRGRAPSFAWTQSPSSCPTTSPKGLSTTLRQEVLSKATGSVTTSASDNRAVGRATPGRVVGQSDNRSVGRTL